MKPRCSSVTEVFGCSRWCIKEEGHTGHHITAFDDQWDLEDWEVISLLRKRITSLRKELAASRAMVASYRETGKPSNVVHKLKPRCGAPVGSKNSMHIHWCTRPQGHNGRHKHIVTIDNMELVGGIKDKLKQLREQAYLESSRAIIREYEQQMKEQHEH